MKSLALLLGEESRISFAGEFKNALHETRENFIQWSAELGRPYGDSISWWSTQTSSRNILVSPLFLNICYLQILKKVLKNFTRDSTLIVICDDWFLLQSVEKLLSKLGLAHARLGTTKLLQSVDFIKATIAWIARWLRGVAVLVRSIYAARRTKNIPILGARASTPQTKLMTAQRIVIHTCVEESCFGSTGSFQDRYFPNLAEWLQKNNYEVVIMPWLFNVKRSTKEAFAWMRSNVQRFLIIEDYFRFQDFPGAAWRILQSAFMLSGQHAFMGLDVTALLQRERIRNSGSASNMRFLLYIPALKRWIKEGNRCKIFIDLFENMPPERASIKALRAYSPHTKLIAYAQVCSIPSDLLIYAIQKDEWIRGYYPDLIVTNSQIAKENLISNGFPEKQLAVGPALRHKAYLNSVEPNINTGEANIILVLLPIDLNAAIELCTLALQLQSYALKNRLKIFIKSHPMIPETKIKETLGHTSTAESVSWVNGAVNSYLSSAALVLGFQSALLDAAAHAAPFLILDRELGLSLNPFTAWEDKYSICNSLTAKEIVANIDRLLGRLNTDEIKNERIALAKELLSGFGRLEAEYFRAFLGETGRQDFAEVGM